MTTRWNVLIMISKWFLIMISILFSPMKNWFDYTLKCFNNDIKMISIMKNCIINFSPMINCKNWFDYTLKCFNNDIKMIFNNDFNIVSAQWKIGSATLNPFQKWSTDTSTLKTPGRPTSWKKIEAKRKYFFKLVTFLNHIKAWRLISKQ